MFNRGEKSTFMESGYFSVLAKAYKTMVGLAISLALILSANDSRTQWVCCVCVAGLDPSPDRRWALPPTPRRRRP